MNCLEATLVSRSGLALVAFNQGARCGHIAGNYNELVGDVSNAGRKAARWNAPGSLLADWAEGWEFGYWLGLGGEALPEECSLELAPMADLDTLVRLRRAEQWGRENPFDGAGKDITGCDT